MKKTCAMCQEPKEPDEFGRNRTTRDGLSYYCRECLATKERARRARCTAERESKIEASLYQAEARPAMHCYMCQHVTTCKMRVNLGQYVMCERSSDDDYFRMKARGYNAPLQSQLELQAP